MTWKFLLKVQDGQAYNMNTSQEYLAKQLDILDGATIFISDRVNTITANGTIRETIFKIIRIIKYLLEVFHNIPMQYPIIRKKSLIIFFICNLSFCHLTLMQIRILYFHFHYFVFIISYIYIFVNSIFLF